MRVKILDKPTGDPGSPAFIKKQLVTELNMLLRGHPLGVDESIASSIEENRLFCMKYCPIYKRASGRK